MGMKKGQTNSGSFRKGNKPWNTGIMGSIKPNSGSFKKGQKVNGKPFPKGNIPWNKGTKGLTKANSGSIKKGQRLSIKTEVKSGQIGERALAYIDGRTHWVSRIRACNKYKSWIKSVFERDAYTCQICGKRGIKIEAHHIKRFSIIITENNIKNYKEAINCNELWDIGNGIVLCKSCHISQHFGTHEKHAKFICPTCGKEFEDYICNRKKSKNVFCSRKCSSKAKEKLKTTSVVGGKYGD